MSFKKNTGSDLDANENLINRTQDDDYESELQKRSSVEANGHAEPSKKKHTYKIILFVGLTILAFILLIVVIITLAGGSYIENRQDNNMFKGKPTTDFLTKCLFS